MAAGEHGKPGQPEHADPVRIHAGPAAVVSPLRGMVAGGQPRYASPIVLVGEVPVMIGPDDETAMTAVIYLVFRLVGSFILIANAEW